MRIGWLSNGRRTASGYGNQTNLFVPELKRAGHEPTIFATYGAEGAPGIDEDGIVTVPRFVDAWMNDVVEAHCKHFNTELLITLVDPFVLDPNVYRRLPWCAWTPVDGEPLNVQNANALKAARWIWAMSRFGETQLKDAGFNNVTYVPHGVNTDIFKLVDRETARVKLGKAVNADLTGKFLIVMNAANKGVPSRKGFSQALEAFKIFSDAHPDAMLYIHTDQSGVYGEHLPTTINVLKIDPAKVLFPNHYRYVMSMIPQEYLNDMYNAGDVFLNCSLGEGFGIAILEAQAAGCPAIVSNYSAMTELAFTGNLVGGHKFWLAPGVPYFMPNVSAMVDELERAHVMVREVTDAWDSYRIESHEKALEYDYREVFRKHMLPSIEQMGRELNVQSDEREERTRKRVVLRGETGDTQDPCASGHDWAVTGVYDNGDLCFPCKRKVCTAEKRILHALQANGKHHEVVRSLGFSTSVNGIDLDIEDDPEGGVAKIICREIAQSYKLADIPFHDGEVVIDVGAHVGVVSIYLAKKYPGITVYAFEPVPANYERLLRNIEANMVKNVIPHNVAVSGLGKDIELKGRADQNSGGFSAMTSPLDLRKTIHLQKSITLPAIFRQYKIDQVKLLKIDCEGMEYEILSCHEEVLNEVDYLVGEFHTNKMIKGRGHSAEALLEMVGQHLPASHIQVHVCQIAD